MVLTCAAHSFTHLFMLVYPTIAVIQAHAWGVDVADLLPLTVPGFVLYGLMAVPFGRWADRSGGWLPVTVGVLGMGLGAILCGVAEERWHIAVGLGVMGLFASAYHPAGLGLISHGMRRKEWALGFNGAFGSGAVALAPGLSEVLADSLGWRGAFIALAIPALVVGVASLMLPIRVRGPERPVVATDTGPEQPLFTRPFIVLCVAMTLGGLAYRGASVVLPALFEERVSFVGHGIATSITYSLAVLMNLVGGHLAERFGPRRVYVGFHALSLPPLIFTAWLSGLPLLLLAALYAGCALGTQPAENSVVAALTPTSRRGVAYGVKFTLAFGVGAAAVPVVAWLLKHHGTAAVMHALTAVVACLVVVVLLGSRHWKGADVRPG